MNFFYVVSGKKLKRLFAILVASLFIIGIVYTEKDQISVLSGNEPSAIYSVATNKKMIALTFDISWGDKRAEPIIDILNQKGVKNVTFFLSSPWSKNHQEIVKKIVESGFEVGSHGHKFVNYSSLSDEEIRKQIRTAHQVLTEETGTAPKLIRLPNGDFDQRVLKIANQLHYTVIQWDTDSLDWKNIGTDNIVGRVVSHAHPGDIVLMHASDSAKETAKALPLIIDKLKQEGYQFVTVSQLISQTKLDQKEVRDQN